MGVFSSSSFRSGSWLLFRATMLSHSRMRIDAARSACTYLVRVGKSVIVHFDPPHGACLTARELACAPCAWAQRIHRITGYPKMCVCRHRQECWKWCCAHHRGRLPHPGTRWGGGRSFIRTGRPTCSAVKCCERSAS